MAADPTDRTDRSGPAARRDFRQDLTDQIVKLVEQGSAPWQKPWRPDRAGSFLALPHNATTGRAYRGGNAMWLLMKAQAMGTQDPRWCTYKQAQERGWQVRKGERGTGVEYWKFDEEINDPAGGKDARRKVKLETPRVFYATVFHASQIDGIEPWQPPARGEGWSSVQAAEDVLTGSGARILHDQVDRAFYRPSTDEIHLPVREAFDQPLDYYEVALHELAHWSGHPTRLGRDLSGSFGSESYAREELRAQMASLFLSAELGVPFNPDRHAAYQGSWVKSLKDDKHEIFRAARDAERIADHILGLAQNVKREAEVHLEQPQAVQVVEAPAPLVAGIDQAPPMGVLPTQAAAPLSRQRAQELVAEFLAEYKGFAPGGKFPLNILILETEQDFRDVYGPNFEQARREWNEPGRKACFDPTRNTVFCSLAAHVLGEEDFTRSLEHEGIGHSGLLALSADDKRAVLDALIAARGSDGLIGQWWQLVEREDVYATETLDRRAEEVYCLACEHRRELTRGLHPAAMDHAWRHSFGTQVDPLQAWALMQVIESVAQGLRDDRLVQQIFPATSDAQFRVDSAGTEPVADLAGNTPPTIESPGSPADGPVDGVRPPDGAMASEPTREPEPERIGANAGAAVPSRQERMAAREAQEWALLPAATSSHPYLSAFAVESHGLRQDQQGNLVVPLSDIDGRLWSLLRITEHGEEIVSDGARSRGCFFLIGADDVTKPIGIAEDYATAAALHEATGMTIACSFSGRNLQVVEQAFRERYPDRSVHLWPAESRTYLKVPFHLKDEARERGALWDPLRKSWFVPGDLNPAPLQRWIAEGVPPLQRREPVAEPTVLVSAPTVPANPSAAVVPPTRSEDAENLIEPSPTPVAALGTARAYSPTQGVEGREPDTAKRSVPEPILAKTGYAVPAAVAARYVVRDGSYWHAQQQAPGKKDGQGTPHFVDKGPKLTSPLEDRTTVGDMVAVALAKQWSSVTVKGSETFRRHAWLEASLAGVQVHGFKPKESDLALLDAAKRQRDQALKISAGAAPQAAPQRDRTARPDPLAAPDRRPAGLESPTVASVRAVVAQAIEHLPQATQTEIMARLSERLRAGVEVQDQMARGEVPRPSLGERIRSQISRLTLGGPAQPGPEIGSPDGAPMTPDIAPMSPAPQPSTTQQVMR